MGAQTLGDPYASRSRPIASMQPRVDPVVYRKWAPDSPLTEVQCRQYERDGFLVLPDVFDQAEIAGLVARSAVLRGGSTNLEPETVIIEPGSGEVRSIFRIHGQDALFGRLAADERLVRIAEFILDDGVYIHQSRLNYKPGFDGREFYWHSDFETWHVEDGMPRMRALSMSVLLSENTSLNGPLMLIPRSHRQYVTCVGETPDDHYRESLKKQEYGVPDRAHIAALADANGIAAAAGRPGSVILFDCNTLHGSNGNITPFARSNAFYVFNAVSNRLENPFGGTRPRPEFIATRRNILPLAARRGAIGGATAG